MAGSPWRCSRSIAATDLVSVGPPPERLTARVAAVELRRPIDDTVVLAGVVRARPARYRSNRLVLDRVCGSPFRAGCSAPGLPFLSGCSAPGSPFRAGCSAPELRFRAGCSAPGTVWVRVGIVRARPTEPVGLTMPRLERTAGGLAQRWWVMGTPLLTGTGWRVR